MKSLVFVVGSLLAAYVVIVGCDLTIPPAGGNGIIWGLDRSDPYYGRLADAASPEEEVGDIVLALCGCGSWRAVIIPDGDSEQTQVTLFFAADEPGGGTDVLTVSGETGTMTLEGVIDQVAGEAEGELDESGNQMVFTAEREQEHIDKLGTCFLCHLGEAPVWPLPETHTEFEVDPPPCLDCHSVE